MLQCSMATKPKIMHYMLNLVSNQCTADLISTSRSVVRRLGEVGGSRFVERLFWLYLCDWLRSLLLFVMLDEGGLEKLADAEADAFWCD